MDTTQAQIRCVHCDEILAMAPVIESWVDAEGREHCLDGGWHKGVIVEKVA